MKSRIKGMNGKKNVSNQLYHSMTEFLGSSFLKMIREKTLYHALKHKHETTKAMILGSLVHCLVLTPEEFDNEFSMALLKPDFENSATGVYVVDNVDEIKERIKELTSEQAISLETDLAFLRNEKQRTAELRRKELKLIDREYQMRIDNVDQTSFISKKAYNSKIKDIKQDKKEDQIQIRAEISAVASTLTAQIKSTQRKIRELKKRHTGKRSTLIASLKQIDPKAIIWGELVETYRQDNMGKHIISRDTLEIAEAMKKSVLEHPVAAGMLRGGECEYAYFAEDADTLLQTKAKPDLMVNGNILVDFKTTKSAKLKDFIFECLKRFYHLQIAYYIDVIKASVGVEIKEAYFIAIENTYPYAVNVLRLPAREIQLGRDEYKKALKEYADYLEQQDLKPKSAFGYNKGNQIDDIKFPDSVFRTA